MLNRLKTSILVVVSALILAGCGGAGVGSPKPFTGRYYGTITFDQRSRGGGPNVAIINMVIDDSGVITTGVVDYGNQAALAMTGSVSRDGKLTATVPNYLGSVDITAHLYWTNVPAGRGGGYSGPEIAGTARVTEQADGQVFVWDSSVIELIPLSGP